MATYYVDSNATGLDDGSSWTDAWTSIASSTGVSGGDTILVASNHSEAVNANLQYDLTAINNPALIISASTSTSAYQAGASISGAAFDGYGLMIKGLDLPTVGGTGHLGLYRHGHYFFEDCTITLSNNYRFFARVASFKSCTWDQSGANVKHQFDDNTDLLFEDCDIIGYSAGTFRFIFPYTYKYTLTFRNCDISNITYMVEDYITYGTVIIENCTQSLTSVVQNENYLRYVNYSITNSEAGTLTNPSVKSFSGSEGRFVSSETTEYRTGGASDGNTNYSFKIRSAATRHVTDIYSIPITTYVESGSQTITVYLAGSASLNDDDFYIEVSSPSEEVSPTSRNKFRTTKPDPLATPTALTSDTSSTWNGTGVGTKQKIEVAISPTIAGTVTVRCYLAKPSTTVYVDPKISTTGNQRVFNGVLVDGEAAPSGGGGSTLHPLYAN